jgi:hypothetical protein
MFHPVTAIIIVYPTFGVSYEKLEMGLLDGVLSSAFLALTDNIGGSINNTASNGSNIINRIRHIKRIIPYTPSPGHPSS